MFLNIWASVILLEAVLNIDMGTSTDNPMSSYAIYGNMGRESYF